MSAKIKDMTHGNPTKLILYFAFPLMIGNMFQQFYTIVDAIVVGQGIGVGALAAVGATDWVYWMLLWTVQGFSQGFSVLIAQCFGAGDKERLKRAVGGAITLSTLFGILLTIIGLIVAKPMLRLLQTPEAILDQSFTYLVVLIIGMLVVTSYNVSASILRAFGDGKTPLVAMIIAGLLNVVLDLLFVLVFHWGVAGAAIATVIAQFFAAVYCFASIAKIPGLKLSKQDFTFDPATWKALCRLGVPTALQYSIIAIGGMAVQYVLNGFGTIFIAGFTATNKLYGLLESTAISLGFAMNTYMGQNSGAGKVSRIKAGMRSVLRLSIGFALAIGGIMIFLGPKLLSLFVSSAEASKDQVIDIAYRYLFIMACLLLALYLLHAYRSSLQGLGNARVPMLSGLVEFVVRVAVALIVPNLIGETGIFLCEPAAWIGAAILLIIMYYREVRDLVEVDTPEPDTVSAQGL